MLTVPANSTGLMWDTGWEPANSSSVACQLVISPEITNARSWDMVWLVDVFYLAHTVFIKF